jgi:DNA repair ATPase RecN
MKLKKLEVNSFAGISPHSPIVVDFTQSKFVHVASDQGTGKTSLINALLVACGQLSKNDKDFINLESGNIDINFDFVGNDKLPYNVRCTKSTFKLTYEGESVPEPIAKLKDLLGVIGVSPMDIKSKPLKDIVKWLSAYSNKSAEEYETDMKKFKDNIKAHRDTRAAANKSAKGLAEWLSQEPLFQKWAESEKKYVKKPDIKELSEQLSAVGVKSDKLLRAEEKLKNYKQTKINVQEQLDRLNAEMAELDENISKGEDFIKSNKGAKKEYDEVKEKYDNAYRDLSAFNMWQQVKSKKIEKEEFEAISIKADKGEKDTLQKVKDLQAEILPDIKGVELITEDTIEDGKKVSEGLYWQGKNVAQMSESEFWGLVLQIWRKFKVKVVVIDNFSSLGSGAVALLQGLVKDGAHVLAAEMDRQQKTLHISYE